MCSMEVNVAKNFLLHILFLITLNFKLVTDKGWKQLETSMCAGEVP